MRRPSDECRGVVSGGGSRPIRSEVAFVLFQGQFDAKRGVVHLLETNTRYEL